MKKSDFTPTAIKQFPLEVLEKAWDVIKHNAFCNYSCKTPKGGKITTKVIRYARIYDIRDNYALWYTAEFKDFKLFYSKYPKKEEFIVNGEKIII